jgi:hypothetical protein
MRNQDKNDARRLNLLLTPQGARVKEQNGVLDPELLGEMFRLMPAHELETALEGIECLAKYAPGAGMMSFLGHVVIMDLRAKQNRGGRAVSLKYILTMNAPKPRSNTYARWPKEDLERNFAFVPAFGQAAPGPGAVRGCRSIEVRQVLRNARKELLR